MLSMSKLLKSSEKVLVRRRSPRETVYLRDYPIDYKLYRETGDFSSIHPNKLRTWLEFAKAARESRGKSFEEVVENVKRKLKGKKFKKESRRVVYLSEEEIIKLKIDAMNKGIDPRWVDILAKPIRERKEEEGKEKKWEKILKPVVD